MSGPLAGVRVIDLTHHLGGPLATMALAQLGADVVKVEPPEGDGWRAVDDVRGESRVFHAVNRGKRGIVLDLRTEEGRRQLRDLARDADVVAPSLAPGVAERIGAGPVELMAENPRLVYCALSAFGPSGPRGTDIALQSEAGVIAANGGRPLPVPAHDTLVPWIMVSGILAALLERERSGRGQVVETSLLEASAALAAHRLIREDSGEPCSTASSPPSTAPTPPPTAASRSPAAPRGCTRARSARWGSEICSTIRGSPTPPPGPSTPTPWPSSSATSWRAKPPPTGTPCWRPRDSRTAWWWSSPCRCSTTRGRRTTHRAT